MNRKTRKQMTMNSGLHSRAAMDRLFVNRGEGERGWISVENVVRVEEHCLLNYLKRAEVNSDRVWMFL